MFPTTHATYEQFANVHKANMEAFKTMTQAALAGTERLASLNLDAARGLLEAGVGNAGVLLDAKALQDPIGLQNLLVRPGYEQIAAYSRRLYEIASEAQTTIATVMAERLADTGSKAASVMGQATSAIASAGKLRKAA